MRSRKKKKKSFLPLLLLFVLVCLAVLSGGAYYWWQLNTGPVSAESAGSRQFVVEAGMTAAAVGEELEQAGIIRNADAFRWLCRREGVETRLRAGVYEVSPAMSPREIISVLLAGPAPDVTVVTLPEGFTVKQIVERLAANGLGTEAEFYAALADFPAAEYHFLENIPAGVEFPLEGFLFPATYYFDTQASPQATLRRFLDRFAEELTPEVQARLAERGMSVPEWVVKGSIVEREAVKSEDRPVIAGVFEKRLAAGMMLQSCATVQYILGEVKPVLSYEDIAIESPYNTYLYTGLPPGPVCNPGRAALEAALYPAETEYLFFVAKPDGYHAFARTYDEHLRNVSEWQ
ncbi:MAG: endolytic transglycosylase MltG [Gracilibacteraceae bacterium]|jgi:UPF0755 protein|nr:endolytic transglycosylase MltG [Gracilibacteraceae bacterium]